jgi:hypothetical protein
MSGDSGGTLWTLLVTFCIIIIRYTETFWSPYISTVLLRVSQFSFIALYAFIVPVWSNYLQCACLGCRTVGVLLTTVSNFSEGKALAASRDCKFIETSSGIQHNVDELLVGILKQIRLRESREKKRQLRRGSKGGRNSNNLRLHGSRTSLSLNIAREILNKMCLNDSKSKSCENLHVL